MKTSFLTSYAGGEDRAWVRRFHNDLENEIRGRLGPFIEGVLIEPGGDSVRAASQAPALVSLISPTHFRDLRCGHEWAIFTERLARVPRERDRCLITVRWCAPLDAETDLPDTVRPMPGFWTRVDAEPYATRGLLHLMRTRELDGAGGYYAVVNAVAARVLDAGRAGLGPLDEATAMTVRPAFGTAFGSRVPATARAAAAQSTEPDQPPRTVAINYVGADQPWADYLRHLLQSHDYEVELVRWNAGLAERLSESVARARDSAERVVTVLSRNFVAPHMAAPVPEGSVDFEEELTGASEDGPPVIPVQVDNGPLPGGLSGRVIRMSGLDEAVIRMFLDAVRRRTA
ncbi:toll/interleukin-1 receptor domain-containing protein [Actinomadura spongiicola]|uniref:Toll/interleukin-1 receptor domain-containing protein n=1 Tax=Actinomadura spongiicola TaxID=2303421 RepID=A0A372G9L1_9ACTN|nr:toll/interleukin-1 receptor domain-containing protein [Actinomadura spongiicola]RFS82060.1 toll/interleukin-1 receptor domain-containing protein [Actinomadura spongiicola]